VPKQIARAAAAAAIIVALALTTAFWPAAAPIAAPEPRGVAQLAPELRDRAQQILGIGNERQRATELKALARSDKGSRPFLQWIYENDTSAVVRSAILPLIVRQDDPATRAFVQRVIEKESSEPLIVASALAALHQLSTLDIARRLEQRIEQAQRAGDLATVRALAPEQERWLSQRGGAALPGFLRTPPPVFAAKLVGGAGMRATRVLAFGDFGNGSADQKRTAAAMLAFHRKSRFDFGITLGDNFYGEGLNRPDEPRWKTEWEILYTPLEIPIYAALGNHDWSHPDSPAAEILYTKQSKSWRLVAPYYTFTAGPAQFFALDTDAVSVAQLLWLEEALRKSQARWKIIYGHHPIYSYGRHGDTPGLVKKLLPLIENVADLYLCGHEHDLQHLRSDGKLQLFVSGGGGAGIRPVDSGPRSVWAKSAHGFTVLDIERDRIVVRFVDAELATLYEHAITTRVAAAP